MSGAPRVHVVLDPSRPAYDGSGPRPILVHEWRSARPDAPLVVLSHGNGGGPAELAWWASALCDGGLDVVALAHHGNTYEGVGYVAEAFVRHWDRPLDVSAVLDAVAARGPVGACGFSLGGYTAAAACGARLAERAVLDRFTGATPAPSDRETPDDVAELAGRFGAAELAAGAALAAADYRDPRVRAGFLLCPGNGPLLDDAATAAGVDVPVAVRWTASDAEAPAERHALRYVRAIDGAEGAPVGGPASGHYGFVLPAEDDPAAKADVVRDSLEFFGRTLV